MDCPDEVHVVAEVNDNVHIRAAAWTAQLRNG